MEIFSFCTNVEKIEKMQYNTSDKFTESEGNMLAVSKRKLDINDKYLQQLEDIKIRVPKGYREVIKKFAVEQGYSNVNQLVIGLINEKMEKVKYDNRIPSGIRDIKEKILTENCE